jgi:phosphatidylserine/phosphatidylglycerophosphate/cardiolipin synthase-like enzyme
MFSLLRRNSIPTDLLASQLLNEKTFYPSFINDMSGALHEVIIESPFITSRRLSQLMPTLQKLKGRKVRVVINTRDPLENDDEQQRKRAHTAIANLQRIGIHVLYTSGHHRKLAIIDRHILYEGSLNVLSQNNSSEVMRRTVSAQLAWQMIRFVGIDQFL